jgi:Predicted hydrolase (metallo-beta-lactamase superfamily)
VNILEEIYKIENAWSTSDLIKLNEVLWHSKEDYDEIINSPVFKMSFTEEQLNRKFRDILRPFIFNNNQKTIYCKFEIEESAEGNRPIFSATTSDMLHVDKQYFSERDGYSILDILYKPYFYEVSFNIDELLKMKYEQGVWYKVIIYKTNDYSKSNPEIIDNNTNASESIDINKDNIISQNDVDSTNDIISGYIAFASSPFEFQKIEAKWGDAVDFEIENGLTETVTDANDADINLELDNCFKNVIKSKLSIMRVGEANAIIGYNEISSANQPNPQKIFAFDLGFPNSDNIIFENKHKNSVDCNATGLHDYAKYKNVNPNLIIISHWHCDHFVGAFMLDRTAYKGNTASKWIAPHYYDNKQNNNANRLVSYLIRNDIISFVGDGYKGYSGNGNYNLFRVNIRSTYGNPTRRKNGITKLKNGDFKNNDCLLLQLNKTLLPGDCYYEYWPTQFGIKVNNDFENIIVPHHGAYTSLIENSSNVSINTDNIIKGIYNIRKKAIICTGNNGYGHPSDKVIQLYQKLNFAKIITTKKCKNISDLLIDDM